MSQDGVGKLAKEEINGRIREDVKAVMEQVLEDQPPSYVRALVLDEALMGSSA